MIKEEKSSASVSKLTAELGVWGEVFQKLYEGETEDFDNYSIEDYVRMQQNDGDVASIVQLITLPIVRGFGEDAEIIEDQNGDKGEVEFIRENLLRPYYQGGMTTPLKDVVSFLSRGIFEGYACAELVYDLREDSKYHLRKIAPRDARVTEPLSDPNGGFNGLRQITSYLGKEIDVSIPAEKSLLYTHNKKKHWLKGESILRPCYYHYDKKHKLYYIAHKAAEFGTIPPIIMNWASGISKTQKQNARKAITKLGMKSAIGLPEGMSVTELQTKASPETIQPLIDHHSLMMHKAVMTQFVNLGLGKNTGAYALSKNQSDLFLMAIMSYTDDFAMLINQYVIPRLVDLNFGNHFYPVLKPVDLSSDARDILKTAFEKIMGKPELLPSDFTNEVIGKLSEELGVQWEAPEEKIEQTNLSEPFNKKKIGLQTHTLFQSWRPLRENEKKVNFERIDRDISKMSRDLAIELKAIYKKQRTQFVADLVGAMNRKDQERINNVSLKYTNEYRDAIYRILNNIFQKSKFEASGELKENPPPVREFVKEILAKRAESITKQHAEEAVKEAKQIAIDVVQAEKLKLQDDQVVSRIEQAMEKHEDEKIDITTVVLAAWAVNVARTYVFRYYKQEITAYLYSAVLDTRTCPYCAKLDGTVLSPEDSAYTAYTPPQHFNCRCIWIAIKNDEVQPVITGIPEKLPTQKSLFPSKQAQA